jgi:hypothetical protein
MLDLSSGYGRPPQKSSTFHPPVRNGVPAWRHRLHAPHLHTTAVPCLCSVLVAMQREKEDFLRRAGACLRLVVTPARHCCALQTHDCRLRW